MKIYLFVILSLGHWDLPFDWAQGGELVEPFEICYLVLGILAIFVNSEYLLISSTMD